MTKFQEVEVRLDEDTTNKALQWCAAHKQHVTRIMSGTNGSHPPSPEDARHPELWKAESWRWFFKNT
jgi:hypothetical protein